MGAAEGIEHVIVLMLENRSFDCMFGALYPGRPGFEGLTGRETNPLHRLDGTSDVVRVWNEAGTNPVEACIPDPDPGELFIEDMNTQLFGLGQPVTDVPPPMSGFADNYIRQPGTTGNDPMAVMHHFTPNQVPVISALAKAFGVCDQWHASAPCQTWPNRFFVHTGTAGGYPNNSPVHFPYLMPSIFKRLSAANRSWRVYFHDLPQAATLADIWVDIPFHFRLFDEAFEADARNGNLPNYTFIEPRYFTSRDLGLIPCDQHPPHNIVYGEQLIARVYNAVRSASTWKKTLLVVTYDEHGGCYDHMPPPLAVPPDNSAVHGFAFDRYGVRVPAIIVSPYMPAGSIVRAGETALPHAGPPYPFDHTSIIATLRKLFGLGGPLTNRDRVAPDLLGPLSLDHPENDGPPSIEVPVAQASPAEIDKHASASPNSMQASLCAMAAHLPASAALAGAHIQQLASRAAIPQLPLLETVEDAVSFAMSKVRALLEHK